MSIEGLIDLQVVEHLSLYGTIKNMDPYAQHLLKTSQNPLLRFRRTWMRREALRQVQEATRKQTKMNGQLAQTPRRKGANIEQSAVIHPYFSADMQRRHGTTWNDPGFIGFVKREEPNIFPKRDAQ